MEAGGPDSGLRAIGMPGDPGGLMAVSPAVRAAVLGWFHQVQEDLVTFINPKRTVAEDPPGGWRLSEIPEGFVLTDVSPKESSGYWRYYEPGTGAWLWFAVYTPEAGEVATNVDGASDAGKTTPPSLCRGTRQTSSSRRGQSC